MASNLRHNKRRNTGIVHGILVRAAADGMLRRDHVSYMRARDILARHFGPGRPVRAELDLFEAIRAHRGVSPGLAVRILGEVKRHSCALDAGAVVAQKDALLRDVNHSLGRDVFARYRLPEYRLLASIQILLDHGARSERILENIQRARIEEGLVRYMSTGEVPSARGRPEDEVDDLVCAVAARRFHERYGAELSARQRELLSRYARVSLSPDPGGTRALLGEERVRLLAGLRSARAAAEFRADAIMASRLEEAISGLAGLDPADHENAVGELMLYRRLEEELKSDG